MDVERLISILAPFVIRGVTYVVDLTTQQMVILSNLSGKGVTLSLFHSSPDRLSLLKCFKQVLYRVVSECFETSSALCFLLTHLSHTYHLVFPLYPLAFGFSNDNNKIRQFS